MVVPPRRPANAVDAAEAAFKPVKPTTHRAAAPAAPAGRELVSLRIDRAVLEHFQADGPGWQDRLNEALRRAVEKAG